ncbi:unnamed protein product [Rotaria sp. Silwood2]|nr:unnamed protein product [Rotaria sp. Silwood2]CAF3306939.1 unnamed protein product [Rotaria sp. Silwood2]CAF3373734.1 unnamed protein product [Rotaria sp. Silwood2]CAF4164605.1 unnamed protein product [Rotaria sp. Silwood2]CAF4287999.1 unnamed protein product [Rotaria sp. Silwood2]
MSMTFHFHLILLYYYFIDEFQSSLLFATISSSNLSILNHVVNLETTVNDRSIFYNKKDSDECVYQRQNACGSYF